MKLFINGLGEKEMTGDETNDLLQLVMGGMGWDKEKAQQWFNEPNPLFGGATPNSFELMGGKEKLEKIIRQHLSENEAPVASNAGAELNIREHATHFDDCGCLSARKDKRIAELEEIHKIDLIKHERLERELKLAIAHDLQPYPTAEAYERVCAALHRKEAEIAELEAQIETINKAFGDGDREAFMRRYAELEKRNAELQKMHAAEYYPPF